MAFQLGDTLTLPGFVDPHVHLREPSTNLSETIFNGTRAALLGGYVLLGDMPNNPGKPVWSRAAIANKHALMERSGCIPETAHFGAQPESDNIGEIEYLVLLSLMMKLYAAFTTGNPRDYEAADFRPIMQRLHEVAPDFPVGLHSGKDNLEDFIGLIARDFGHPLLVHHMNNPTDVEVVNKAKRDGLPVKSAVTMHHLVKTSHDKVSEGWLACLLPELAPQHDAEKLLYQLGVGDIDMIETDHAPHPMANNMKAEAENPDQIMDADHTTCNGVRSIENAASMAFYLVYRKFLTMERLVDAMSTQPAEFLGVKLDPRTKVTWEMKEYMIGEEHSRHLHGATPTPFLGKLAIGVPVKVQIGNKLLVAAENRVIGRDSRVITQRGAVI